MSTPDDRSWYDSLMAALAAAGIQLSQLIQEANQGDELSWLPSVLDGSAEMPPSLAEYVMISALTNIAVPILTGEVHPSASAGIALRASTADATIRDLARAHARGLELIHAARLVSSWSGHHAVERHVLLSRLRGVLSHNLYPPKAGIETAGQLRRRLAKLSVAPANEPLYDLVGLVESLGIPVEFTNTLPDTVHGLTVHDGSLGRWEGAILIRAGDPWVRQRYTLAHELCHGLYEDPGTTFVNDDQTPESDTTTEQRAETFARNFLAPSQAIRSSWSVGSGASREALVSGLCELILHFGLSRVASMYAVRDLQLAGWKELLSFKDDSVSSLMRQAGRLDEWTELSRDQHLPGASPWLTEAALALYSEGKVSVQTIASVLGRDVDSVGAELAANGWG